MTKKEIIDKVYDDYLKDYGRVGYIGMNSIEKACKSEFEKNGIEYDHYDVKEALESKSHYNIVNAYVKGYSDTREGMTSSSIRDFMIQYKQGLDAGDIEYKDAEFERVAEIFKRYDKYETFNKESKDAIDGLRKDVDMYLSERSSDKESVQNAYKAINAYIYGDSSFGNLSEQVNPPRLIRFREYRRGFQTPHELSFMPATLGRSGFLTTDTAQTQRLCRAASPSAGAPGFAFDAQSTA